MKSTCFQGYITVHPLSPKLLYIEKEKAKEKEINSVIWENRFKPN